MPTRAETRSALVDAAFQLFASRGFEATTVDEIAVTAGVGRTTFFRHFGSKEAVVFPDHHDLLARIGARLEAGAPAMKALAVADAARIVLRSYLAEGDRARLRYRLVRSVPALRDHELAEMRQYQRRFSDALASDWAERPDGVLRAELAAAGVVAAHNVVLRRWLREESDDPERELDHAISLVLERAPESHHGTTSVVVVESSAPAAVVAERVRAALHVREPLTAE